MKKLVLFACSFLFVSMCFGQDKPSQNVATIKKIEPAVVKISILLQGVIPVSFGTGFFIDNEGTVLTSRHVVRAALSGPYKVRATDSHKVTLGEVKLISCSDKIDVCALKVERKSSSFISLNSISIEKGMDVLVMGHPRGYDFSVSTGIISGFQSETVPHESRKMEYLQMTAPISPGNSGGPVVDKDGRLLGISTWIRTDVGSQNLNFAISTNTIRENISLANKAISFLEYKNIQSSLDIKFYKDAQKKLLAPIIADLEKGNKLNGGAVKLSKVEIPFQKGKLIFQLPEVFGAKVTCSIVSNVENNREASCVSGPAGALLNIKIFNMKKDGLKEYNRRLVSESKPLKEIEEMMKAGEWNQYSKLLTAENKKHLYSSPKPWKCAEEKLTSQYFWSNSYSCTSSIYNDLYAGFSTFSYAAQRNEKDFAVIASITIANPDTVNFYFEIPTIIIGSAKFE